MTQSNKTALVTGANSGLGFSAAAQLAEAGWGEVILACRTLEKAEAARGELVKRCGRDPFSSLAIDTAEVSSASEAAKQLADRGVQVDFMLLNAASLHPQPHFNLDGIELTYASTLIGHHVLAVQALTHGVLAESARIVIAGSESARGNVPGEVGHDVMDLARQECGGDLVAAIEAFCRLQLPQQQPFKNTREYGTAKLFVAWWAAALARRLPRGMTVNAVSPGGAMDTNLGRHAPLPIRLLLLPIVRVLGRLSGMTASTEVAAKRYLDAEAFGDDISGQFHATAHRKKVAGPMGVQTWPEYFGDEISQEACFEALVKLTGVAYPQVAISTEPG